MLATAYWRTLTQSAILLFTNIRHWGTKVVGLLREEKRNHFENLNSPDQKVFWKAVKMLNRTTTSIPTLTIQDGFQATTSSEKATTLNLSVLTKFNVFPPCQIRIFCLQPLHLVQRRSRLLRSMWLWLYSNSTSRNPRELMVYQLKCWSIQHLT